MSKLLVTGGAGYIGSHFVLEALQNNHEVIVVDSLERGYTEAINRVEKLSGKKINFIQGDLRSKNFVFSLVQDILPDCVLHFAGYKSVSEGELNPKAYFENNVTATQYLLEAMVSFGINKIVFSSSAAVYGITNDLPVTENTSVNPISVYGKTKLEMEEVIQKFTKMNPKLSAVSFRYFNAVGAHESGLIGEDPSRCTNFIPLVMNSALNQGSVKLFGNKFKTKDGSQERDYIHVTDLANAHIKAIETNLEAGKMETINLSTGKTTSCLEIINLVEKISGKKVPYEIAAPRQGDPEIVYASNSYAKNILNWEAIRSIEISIQDQWNWMSKNPKGYKN